MDWTWLSDRKNKKIVIIVLLMMELSMGNRSSNDGSDEIEYIIEMAAGKILTIIFLVGHAIWRMCSIYELKTCSSKFLNYNRGTA